MTLNIPLPVLFFVVALFGWAVCALMIGRDIKQGDWDFSIGERTILQFGNAVTWLVLLLTSMTIYGLTK